MPLKLDLEVEGQALVQAYIRVIRLWGSPDEGLQAVVGIWANRPAWVNGKKPLETFNISAPWRPLCLAGIEDAILADSRFVTAVDGDA
jgi:hypothetical protein